MRKSSRNQKFIFIFSYLVRCVSDHTAKPKMRRLSPKGEKAVLRAEKNSEAFLSNDHKPLIPVRLFQTKVSIHGRPPIAWMLFLIWMKNRAPPLAPSTKGYGAFETVPKNNPYRGDTG
ncbi:hypothetical protein [Eubacterium limosum]|uniref:hypothetical protein n=1 Tax=Eubacterium limosum TaxID=1736 RepID=UPI0022E90C6F|nr:hypothetical protein [Eubacterium limosum]